MLMQQPLYMFAPYYGIVGAIVGLCVLSTRRSAPFLTTPGNFGAGTVRSGAIELSNTDVGRNLVDLIVAATNYRGNARVISSVQQLIDELLVLGR